MPFIKASSFAAEKIFNGFKILNDELLFDALFLYWDLPGKKILGYNFLKFCVLIIIFV